MNNDIKVSVIVITYNHEQFIQQALESILMQKVDFKYEILIGDDASTDNTPEILKEYKAKYPDIIKLYLNPVNLGATCNAYNLLISAKGIYLATCEGDDYWTDKNKLQIQVDFLDLHKEYIGCCHTCSIVNENNELIKNQKISWISKKAIFTIKDFKGIFLPGQASTIVRLNIYKNNDCSIFYKASKFIGDRTTMLIYLSKGKFFKFDKIMSAYRIQEHNKENITFKIYKDKNKTLNEFKYTLTLEKYAKNVLKIDAGFRDYKRKLFVDAFIGLIKNTNLSNFNLLLKILQSEKMPIDFFIYLPYGILYKIYKKIVFKV